MTTPPHSVRSTHLSPCPHRPSGSPLRTYSPCPCSGSSVHSSPNRSDVGKPQVFLFPEVGGSGTQDEVEPALIHAARMAAQATCGRCHQRLKYADSLPTTLPGAGKEEDGQNTSSSLIDEKVVNDTEERTSPVNLARTWDPKQFHAALQPHLNSVMSTHRCPAVACACSTHGRPRRRSTTRLRPTGNRRYPSCSGPRSHGYLSALPRQQRHSSFHGLPSTSLTTPRPSCTSSCGDSIPESVFGTSDVSVDRDYRQECTIAENISTTKL